MKFEGNNNGKQGKRLMRPDSYANRCRGVFPKWGPHPESKLYKLTSALNHSNEANESENGNKNEDNQ